MLLSILRKCGAWKPERDEKLAKLHELITKKHPGEKVLVFSQFADTVIYLNGQLTSLGVKRMAEATGDTDDPTKIAWRFSPNSNNKRIEILPENELDVVISTDVLSEGQNLQDGSIVKLRPPLAIIRLINELVSTESTES
jgi:superfamily II DNA/RNA helicase